MGTLGNPEAIVKKLRKQITKRWPGSVPNNFETLSIISTKIPDLDSILPKRGLPIGEFIQISGSRSSGKTYFLFKLLSGLKPFKAFVIYFDLTGEISPQVIKASGLDLTKFIHIRPKSIQASIRAAEVLFGAKEIKCVVFDLVGITDKIPKVLILRLKRIIKKSKGIAVFLTDENFRSFQGNLIGLKLKVTRIPISFSLDQKPSDSFFSEKLSVTVEKNFSGKGDKSVELVFDE